MTTKLIPLNVVERNESKYATCVSCKERVRPGEKRFIVDERNIGGKKKAVYCNRCKSSAIENNTYRGQMMSCSVTNQIFVIGKNGKPKPMNGE